MLPKAGGTMTGPLVLATDPANNLEAATKQYVDRSNPLAGPIPPANPEPGELWFDSVTLQLYVWYDDGTSAQWVVAINQAPYIPPLDFLPISGGTLTGPLIGTSASFDDITAKNNVNATNAVGTNSLILNCITQTGSYINGYNNSKVRWSMGFIDRASETGGNAGSHFTISRYNDAGGYIDTPLHLNRTNGAATFSSNVDVVGGILTVGNYSSNGYLGLNSARGATSYIQGNKNGAVRWQLALGDSAVESGGNVGSNLSLAAFDDAGGYLSTPIQINRASGSVFLPKAQVGAWASQPNDIVHKAYVDNVIVPVADGAVPVGGVIAFAGPTIPPNYLLCNGAQYLPSDAPALFNAIGGYYFWDGVKFGVPYLYDRVPVGAGYSWGLAAAGGEINHTLSVHELAHHAHGLYDPAHIHGLPDPGHNHGFADPGHAHGAVQDGHNHGNWEDAHQHNTHMNQSNQYGIGQYAYMNPLGNIGGSDWASDWRQCGVYSDVRQPGTYTYGAGTGAWNYAAGTGQWVDWGGTRCSIYGEGGNGAHNNMPPFVAMYWIIRYR
jgi:microcystin-dependent protein